MFPKRNGALTLAATGLVLSAALSGCSSSTSGSSSSPTSASTSVAPESAAFCQSVGGIQTAVVAQQPDMAEINSLLATMQDNAPAELAAEIPIVSKAAQAPAEQPDADFDAAFGTISTWIADNCDAQVIEATISADGKLSDVPATAQAGLTVIRVTSPDGKAGIAVLRKSDGVTESAAQLLQLPEKQVQSKLSYVGGGSPAGVAELTAGDYVVAAFATDGPPSDALDMTVE